MARGEPRSLRETRIWQTSTPTAAASCRYSAISAGWPTAAGMAVATAPGPASGPSYWFRVSRSDATSRSWPAAEVPGTGPARPADAASSAERTEPTSACSAGAAPAVGPSKASSRRPSRAAPDVTRMIS